MADRIPIDRVLLAVGALASLAPWVFGGADLLRILCVAAGLWGVLRATNARAPKWVAIVPAVTIVGVNLVEDLFGFREVLDPLRTITIVAALSIVVHAARAHVGRALALATVGLLVFGLLELSEDFVGGWAMEQLARIANGALHLGHLLVGVAMTILALGPLLERPLPMYSTRLGATGLVGSLMLATSLVDGEPRVPDDISMMWLVLFGLPLAGLGMIGLVRSDAPRMLVLGVIATVLAAIALVVQGPVYERSLVALPMLVAFPGVALAAGRSAKLGPRHLRRAIVALALLAAAAMGIEWMERTYVQYASDLASTAFLLCGCWYALLVTPPTEMPAWAIGTPAFGDPYRSTAFPGGPGAETAPAPMPWPRWVALAGALVAAGAAYYQYDQGAQLRRLSESYSIESLPTYDDGDSIERSRFYDAMASDAQSSAVEHEMPALGFGALAVGLVIAFVVLHLRYRRSLAPTASPDQRIEQ